MDPDPPSSSRRKFKFPPKPRPQRHITTETEEDGSGENNSQQFSHGAAATSIRSFGRRKERTDDGSFTACSEASATEVLDKAELEEAQEYDENSLSSASHLGLLDKDDTPSMLVFMLPYSLPLGRRPTNANGTEDDNMKTIEKSAKGGKGKGKEKVMVDRVAESSGISNGIKNTTFEELPEGYIGKMLVYRSGAVKLKLGEFMFDVSPGSECSFPQKVMAINIRDKECCEVGEGSKRAVVTPDIDFLLNTASHTDLGY